MNATPDIACEHADRCGGCPLIDLSYVEQLARKHARVVEASSRYASLERVNAEPVAAAAPIVGYRTRAKLIAAPGGKLGLFAKGGGHQVVDIPRCRVLAPVLAKVAMVVRAQIADAIRDGGPLAPFDPSGQGSLRAVDLREVRDGESVGVLATFVVQRDRVQAASTLEQAARELLRAAPEVLGVACNFHDGSGPQVLGGETVLLAGVSSARDQLGASTHMATFGSFAQAHREQATRVHAMLIDAFSLRPLSRSARACGTLSLRPLSRSARACGTLSLRPLSRSARACGTPSLSPAPGDPSGERLSRVLDLYGGSGSMALCLAAAGARVHLVESFGPAVAQARIAAEAQGLPVEAQCVDVAAGLRTLVERGERFDAAVVNPPRRGTHPAVREWLVRVEPRVIAYISCDPETLARDLDHFVRLGYAPTSLQPLDMIPLTNEVETVAVLRRAAIPPPPVMYEDAEVLVVDKAPHEPTTPQGEYAGSLLARVRRIAGAENAVPVHRLDVGTSGLVMFARHPRSAAKWTQVIEAASTRKVYIAAARGITPLKGTVARTLERSERAATNTNAPRTLERSDAPRTRYKRSTIAAGHSVLRVIPEQGHTQQIRRHLAAIGHPLIGDDRYGDPMTNRFFEEKNGLDRAFLHCSRLEFDHPDTATRTVVDAPLPGDLRAVLERMTGVTPQPPQARAIGRRAARRARARARQALPR
jgi:23S rRNA (uracil1939-C5)-methyltransferase